MLSSILKLLGASSTSRPLLGNCSQLMLRCMIVWIVILAVFLREGGGFGAFDQVFLLLLISYFFFFMN